jgi:hypothetical protein
MILTREILYSEINNIYELILLISEKNRDLSIKLDDFKKCCTLINLHILWKTGLSQCTSIQRVLEEQNTGENTNNTDSLDSNEDKDRIYSILTNFLARTLSTKDTNEEKTLTKKRTNEEKTLTTKKKTLTKKRKH